ncbi:unnamed protein product [Withania somnifera]
MKTNARQEPDYRHSANRPPPLNIDPNSHSVMVTGQGLVVFRTSDLEYKPRRKTAISCIPSTQ